MCLLTTQKEPRLTKKDLVVWKYGQVYINNTEKVFSSYYYHLTWRAGRLEESELVAEETIFSSAEKFDSIVSDCYQTESDEDRIITEVSCGLHAALTIKRLEKSGFPKNSIHRFIIPAGSLVFKDKSGLIASNQMYWAPLEKKTKKL